ncbi:hypothetical protein [Vulgatibacter sp.]|uniref:hypothetical protein n=1 Tax=Vulgatibacter sp. TaxID=1971226 RepID=UPI00356AFE4E
MKSPALRFLLLAFALLAAACGSDPATCSVEDNGDGTRTITCPGADPVLVVDGDKDTSCTIGSADDGGKVIQCSDGTIVRIDKDGHVVFPGTGSVAGRARLFGLEDHAGIRVSAEGTEYETLTNEDGDYVLGPLPAGIHVVTFEAPGRITERVENVPVINGTWQMPAVELKFGRWVTSSGQAFPAPSGDAALVFVPSGTLGGWLTLWELDDGEQTALGGIVSSFAFDASGGLVLYQERTAVDGPLQLWDRAAAERTTVAERSVQGAIVPGGAAVVYQTADGDAGCTLHLWTRADGTVREIGPCLQGFSWPGGPQPWLFAADGRHFVYADEAAGLVLYDITSGEDYALGSSQRASVTRILPGGRFALALQQQDSSFTRFDLVLVDGETGDRRVIGSDVDGGHLVSPDGGTILFQQNVGAGTAELVAHRVAGAENLVITSGSATSWLRFSRDGSRILWIEGESWQAGVLHVLPLDAPENRASYSLRSVQRAEFSGSGEWVVILDSAGELHRWNPATDADHLVDTAPAFWQWSPDGSRLALMTFASEVAIVEIASGDEHRAPADPSGNTFTWIPDGSGIVFIRTAADAQGVDLLRWETPDEPQRIGGGFVSGFQVSPAGTVAFLECTGRCENGLILVLHDGARQVREPVDGQVTSMTLQHGVLVYSVASPLPQEAERNGFYVAQVP